MDNRDRSARVRAKAKPRPQAKVRRESGRRLSETDYLEAGFTQAKKKNVNDKK